jgi:hypothetical protein
MEEPEVVPVRRDFPFLGHRAPDDLPDDWSRIESLGEDPRPLPPEAVY